MTRMTTAAENASGAVRLAMPPRPARPLSTFQIMRVGFTNTLAACDEELFDELFVERRYIWGRLFVVSDPEGVKRVLQDNVDNYPRIEAIRRVFAFGSGTGMLCAEGDVWRRHRRMLNPTLDRRAVLSDVPGLVQITEELAGLLRALPPGHEVHLGDTFTHLLTRSTSQVFAGDDRSIDPMIDHMGHYPGEYGLFDFLTLPRWLRFIDRFRRSPAEARELHPLLARMLDERRSDTYAGGKDLLWRLANARDRDTGESMSIPELEDEALTLGSTSVTSLQVYSWLWYLLAQHPWAEERVEAELSAVLGDRSPTAEDLPKLVYTRKVVDEAMRLYPPLPVMLRAAATDDVVCGRKIPRKSVVAVMPWVVHRHRRLWRDPDVFDPERFAPDEIAARSRYAYLPFSVGPHVCIGATLALIEILITVAVLARRFRFRLVPGQNITPVAWTSLRPGRGIRMTLEPRGAAVRSEALSESIGSVG
ncbi:MAG TPA: cytochrome P450 [Stellaceae bacterium]|nr:cytochrome P450 [Stellaceae bacterium]